MEDELWREMTNRENNLKKKLVEFLKKQGYVTIANIFDKYLILQLTDDPEVTAYTDFKYGAVVLNAFTDITCASLVLRHELMHQIFNHDEVMIAHLAKKFNLNPKKLTGLTRAKLSELLYRDEIFNIAGDYDISNRAYSDEDKQMAKSIIINGKIIEGLVTEDRHADWVDLSVTEMYDRLVDELSADLQQARNSIKKNMEDQDLPDWNEDDVEDDFHLGRKDDFGGNGAGDDTEYIKGYFNEDDGRFYDEDGNLLNAEDFVEIEEED